MIFGTAGSKFYIGGPKGYTFGADLTAADFAGVTWTEVQPIESLGTFGDSAGTIDFSAIGHARKIKGKGIRDAGTMEVVVGLDYGDAGQLALLAAEKTSLNYAFKVTFNDAPAGGTPSERLFVALVMSAAEELGGADNVMKLNSALAINSNVVRINAAEDD